MDLSTIKPPVLFLSDVHFGGFSDQENHRIETELIQLIDYCEQKSIQIFILGDLFDYWMEFPDYIPSYGNKLLDRFETYNRNISPIPYITGNHDHWTYGHLADRGFKITHEYIHCSLDQKKLMLLHGDGLADNHFDLPRPLMHRILRNSFFLNCYRAIFNGSTGLTLMKYFSRFNRKLDDPETHKEMLSNWAKDQLQKSDFDLIISGHDHVPRREQYDFGSYISLGTFYKHRTLALYNNSAIKLVCWEPETHSLKPF